MLRRASVRRTVLALEAFRDSLRGESEADYNEVAAALISFTDRILRELVALEDCNSVDIAAEAWWDPADPIAFAIALSARVEQAANVVAKWGRV